MSNPDRPAPTIWTPTWAFGRAVLLTGLLLVAAVVLGRVDLVVLATPFALGTAYALRRRPTEPPRVWISGDDGHLVEGGDVAGTVSVGNPGAVSYDVAVLRARVSPWLRIERATLAGGTVAGIGRAAGDDRSAGDGRAAGRPAVADRPFVTSVAAETAVDLELAGTALRWGRHPFGPAGARVAAAHGLLVSRAVIAEPIRAKVYPKTEPFEAVEAMPRAAGLVGAHHSRRPGEGGELAGVRVFAPGDRLRRIDWRVSLRARQLHVAATLSDRDAEVVVLLDVLAEAGRSGGITGTASVLDTTVRAAAAIAEHYLHRGDRVALLEYGPSARRLRPATGRRQYLTVLEWLLEVKAQSSPHEPYDQVFGPQLLSADALVVVLTPLLEERSAQMLARLARSGRFVVAVDTLPVDLSPPKDRGWAEVAYRLWRLDRDTMIAQLREHGVPVVPWAGAGSLDQVLRDVARLATAPRVGGR
ncbi:Uncharacterized conserved protein, DUF58 family, contains vWF domain [Micromonospora phaseoli]|uniref:Uncharacterized conserved protein, DUF58 family, contains vWF domain n=1 Tax=Micromonospora phaseoli TaxID=1144548 RepID=A0A1H7A704_9ACTN|nr:DUF58 domain-containing protein [Micromonospora phaseoli]PZV97017.1 uncharacterized protein (DUF58 family) [Micromonospora phaseoli]GIJ77994.1 hypothetical protein Xph01_24260 [Micromonospora phaseoli]SEJ56815.1 Uncharacterized conserved protein, DUF58 family, contains vWF domain [Micromonospora phaseoli]